MPTGAGDVVALLDLFEALGAHPVVLGGWGVDALAGRCTRVHRDLDVLVCADHLERVVEECAELGFVVGVDWLRSASSSTTRSATATSTSIRRIPTARTGGGSTGSTARASTTRRRR